MKDAVLKLMEDSLKAIGIEGPFRIEMEIPKDEAHGDISTPAAMGLAKILKRPPIKIAEDILKTIKSAGGGEFFDRIEIAGPGFINFTFKTEYLHSALRSLIKEKEDFLRQDIGGGKRILIEFVSANPTGPLHLGHGRGAALGLALSNLFEAAGYKVERQYYINDAGAQVRLLGLSVYARYMQLLGAAYPLPDDGYRGAYIEEIAKALLNNAGDKYKDASPDDALSFFTDFSLKMMLEEIKEDLDAFGVRFDTWQSEKELYASHSIDAAIEYLKGKGFIYEKDGALWFKATSFGDEKDRVIIKKTGEYTYFASDIAYHRKKVEAGHDGLVDIWGADHHGYIPRLKCVMEALGYDKNKLRVLLVQMVSLLRGGKPMQMSKRAGEFVTLREVMEDVGADTTKFIFLTRRPDSHLDFDLDSAKARSAENPVYYVQYANARINSIFAHAGERGYSLKDLGDKDTGLLSEKEELNLIKKLLFYPMVFEAAATAFEPHRITYYLQELAGIFHPYYNKHRVVTENESLTYARLALVEAVRLVLKEGLTVLGIGAPERM
jgi:arginyl-tRNA synthetase